MKDHEILRHRGLKLSVSLDFGSFQVPRCSKDESAFSYKDCTKTAHCRYHIVMGFVCLRWLIGQWSDSQLLQVMCPCSFDATIGAECTCKKKRKYTAEMTWTLVSFGLVLFFSIFLDFSLKARNVCRQYYRRATLFLYSVKRETNSGGCSDLKD